MLTICITTMTRADLMEATLRSMLMHAPGNYRVVVVNNGPEQKQEVDEAISRTRAHSQVPIEVIHSPENIRATGAARLGLQLANYEDNFLLLSDDVWFVPSGRDFWDEMNTVLQDRKVGLVGPLTDNVPGFQRVHLPCAYEYLKTNYLHGLFLLGRTAVWEEVGMDPDPLGGEEVDMAINLMIHGYSLVINRRCFVHHVGSATTGLYDRKARNARQDKVWVKLMAKYGHIHPRDMPGFPWHDELGDEDWTNLNGIHVVEPFTPGA